MQSERRGWLCDILLSSKLSEGRRGAGAASPRGSERLRKRPERGGELKSLFPVPNKRQPQPWRRGADFTWIAPAMVYATFMPYRVFPSIFRGSFRLARALVQFHPTHQIISAVQ